MNGAVYCWTFSLQVNGAALLALRPDGFASTLSLANPQQAEHLKAFLSAIQKVAADPTGTAQQQQQAAAGATPIGTATSKKKRAGNETEPGAATVPLKKKKLAVPSGLQAPRVSGLKRPAPPVAAAPNAPVAAGHVIAIPPAADASSEAQQQPAEPSLLQEAKGDGLSTEASKKPRKQKEIKTAKTRSKKPRGAQKGQDQQQQEQKQEPRQETADRIDVRNKRKAKLIAWGSSVLALRDRFEAGVQRQLTNKNRRVRSTGLVATPIFMPVDIYSRGMSLGQLPALLTLFSSALSFSMLLFMCLADYCLYDGVCGRRRRAGRASGVSATPGAPRRGADEI